MVKPDEAVLQRYTILKNGCQEGEVNEHTP